MMFEYSACELCVYVYVCVCMYVCVCVFACVCVCVPRHCHIDFLDFFADFAIIS